MKNITLILAVLVALVAASASAAVPPKPGQVGTPPINPAAVHPSNAYSDFDGATGQLCKADHSFCPGVVSLRSRLLNKPSRYNTPIVVQLALDYQVSGCAEITCSGSMLASADKRPLVLFIDGHRAGSAGAGWYRVGTSMQMNPDGSPVSTAARYVSLPLTYGFSCGWHQLAFGILGDSWAGADSTDGFGKPIHYAAQKARWALSAPLAVYAGDCGKARR
jgi:hypothetical protein